MNPHVYTDRNYLADNSTNVFVGRFVWAVTPQADGDIWRAQGAAPSTGIKPLGIVQRNLSYVNYSILDGGSLLVPETGLSRRARAILPRM